MIQDIAPHRLHNAFRPGVLPSPDDPVFVFQGQTLALRMETETAALPTAGDFALSEASFLYLFQLDDHPCFLLNRFNLSAEELPVGCRYESVRELRHKANVTRELSFSAFTGLQLASWYRDNVYCGTCGSPTAPGKVERSIICPGCGRTIYPRIIPAVIVGVTKGDYLLHTKYNRNRGVPFYALVAGFTEIGETFEETVAREVMEETGLKVKNIRYYKSQPWGIVDDILAGFYCDVDGDSSISLDTSELCEGVWIHRKDIIGQPDDASLTHHMMITFRDGLEPKS